LKLRPVAEQPERIPEALGVIAGRMVPGSRCGEHVDAISGRHDVDEVIELALAVVGDGLEA
jgi:hypothetical protein